MKHRTRRNPASSSMAAPLEIQQLETRQLLTGQVTVSITQAGDVNVVGDSKDNDVSVTVNANTISIVGNSGTSIKANGQVVAAGVVVNVPKPAAIRDLNVNLKGGHDSVYVKANSAITVSRNVKVNTGSGNDVVLVESSGGLIKVGGSVSVDTGSGNDAVAVYDSVKFGNVNNVADLQAIPNDTANANSQNIRVGKDIHVRTGGGNDIVGMLGVEAKRDVDIHSGLGHGDVVGLSNVRAGRNMRLIWGDDNAFRNIKVAGKMTVRSGTGDDRFLVENLTASVADVNLGPGRDQLAIGTGVTITKKATISGGVGKDNIVSASPLNGAKIRSFEGQSVNSADIIDDIFADLMAAGLV